jgi:hypothetical protein
VENAQNSAGLLRVKPPFKTEGECLYDLPGIAEQSAPGSFFWGSGAMMEKPQSGLAASCVD